MKRSLIALSLLSPVLVAGPVATFAQAVHSFDYPKSYAVSTDARGISNSGEIVGVFYDRFENPYGFTFTPSSGYSQPITYPSRGSVNVRGINSAGIVCGYLPSVTGFFYDGQSFTTYLVPGAAITTIEGLNDSGVFTGNYSDTMAGGIQLGYINDGGNLTTFTVNNSAITTPYGINNSGQTVGTYSDGPPLFVDHGWYRAADGTVTLLDYPGSHSTQPAGINDSGIIVGAYQDASLRNHGFILVLPGSFTTFDVPGAQSSYIRGISNDGRIVGAYIDAAGNGHAFRGSITP